MTPRSPKQHQPPKTTTISRRLRNRADQNLSVQPPEIPQLRGARPRRAASFPTPRHNPVGYHIAESHPPSLAWDTPDLLDSIPRSDPATASTAGEEQSNNLLVSQNLDFTPYDSPQAAQSELVTCVGAERSRSYPVESAPALNFLPSPLPSVSGGHEFELRLSADPEQPHDPFLDLQDMSTLGFMMPPSQYGMNHYGSPTSYSSNYPPQQSYADPRSSNSGPYGAVYAPSSALPHESQPRRPDEHAALPPYQQPSLPRSPYQQQQQPLNAMRGGAAPLASAAHTYSYPAPHNSVPSQSLASTSATYPPYVLFNHATDTSSPSQFSQPVYPPVTYSMNEYHPLPTMYPPASAASSVYPAYGATHDIAAPSTGAVAAVSSSPNSQSSAVMPRILNSRPKPQCWEHGCNGRQFSTFSNLLRHQREKSGTASKSYCPRCNAEFTRTTARNGHMAHDKCKPRRPSDASR